jgi:DNA-directed RNA polymerase subunit alpha
MTLLERMYDVRTDDVTPVEAIPEPSMKVIESSSDYGKFAIEPLLRGRGLTMGNSLRRSLLGAIPGTAVTWARIDGIEHEFASLPGMREDTLDFLLNLKGMRIRSLADRTGRLRIQVDGEGEVRAGDVMSTSDFQIVNPEHHLATLDRWDSRLTVELNVEQGTGYRAADQNDAVPTGVLPIDAVFTPIRKASFSVESSRHGRDEEMERLIVEVWTDETMSPIEAIQAAANELMKDLYLVSGMTEDDEVSTPQFPGVPVEKLNMQLVELGLSARTYNSLRRYRLDRVSDVLSLSDADLMKIRNFGAQSLLELRERLAACGVVASDVSNEGEE